MKALLNPWLVVTALVVLGATSVGGYYFGTKHEALRTALVEKELEELRTTYEVAKETWELEAQAIEADARATNAKEMESVKQNLFAATGRAERLERMLSASQAAARSCPGTGAPDPVQSGTAGAGGEPGGDREVGEATREVFAACLRDAERLNALQAEYFRQRRNAAP